MPPRIQPTQAWARAISFCDMPPVPMMTPMVMKNGTAIRLKEKIPLTICWQKVTRLMSLYSMHRIEEMATAKAMGKRSRIMAKKLPSRMSMAMVAVVIWRLPRLSRIF